jgi:hypothetical protein
LGVDAELYAASALHPVAGDVRWFRDLIGAPVARLTEALPDEVRRAAEAPGWGRERLAVVRACLQQLTD